MIRVTHYETVSWRLSDSQGNVQRPDDISLLFKGADWDSEQMWVLGMNIKNDVHLKHLVAKGAYNAVMIRPADFLVPPLRLNLRHLILVHNHPSGDPKPSEDDIVFTRKAKKACDTVGVSLLDHVIITQNGYYSFKKEGLL